MFPLISNDLRPNQAVVINRVCDVSPHKITRGVIVVHDTGSGKTRTACSTAARLLHEKQVNKVFVIAPLSVTSGWERDMTRCKLTRGIEWDIVTPQKLFSDAKSGLSTDYTGSMLIIDEAHALRTFAKQEVKGDEGERRERKATGLMVQNIIEISSMCSKVIVMTATPVVNNVEDLHSLLSLLNGEAITDNATQWKEMVEDDETFQELFKSKVSVYMPDADQKMGYPQVITSRRQLRMSDAYYKEYLTVQNAEIGNYSEGVRALLKDKDGTCYYSGMRRAANNIPFQDSPKIDVVVNEVLDMTQANDRRPPGDFPDKLAIFSSFKSSGVEHISSSILPSIIPGKFALITGSTSPVKRAKIIKDYNDDKITVLLFSRAASEGVDLRGTTRMIVMEPQWNGASTDQAIARAVRLHSHEHMPVDRRLVRVTNLILSKPTVLSPNDKMPMSVDEILEMISNRKRVIAKRVIERLKHVSIEMDL